MSKCQNPDCTNTVKAKNEAKGFKLCFRCHLQAVKGEAAVKEYDSQRERKRMRLMGRGRRSRKSFECDMGWASCTARGFCNGDC